MGEASRRRAAGETAFKTPKKATYNHASALAEDKSKAPGRLCSARTDTAEFMRIVLDPSREVPRDQWHQDDVADIERMLSQAHGRRVVRRDDGLYTFADRPEFF